MPVASRRSQWQRTIHRRPSVAGTCTRRGAAHPRPRSQAFPVRAGHRDGRRSAKPSTWRGASAAPAAHVASLHWKDRKIDGEQTVPSTPFQGNNRRAVVTDLLVSMIIPLELECELDALLYQIRTKIEVDGEAKRRR